MKRCFYIAKVNGTDLLKVTPTFVEYPPRTGVLQMSWAKWMWLAAYIKRQGPNYKQEVADGGGGTCALCVAHYENCPACPIHRNTGRYGCHGTPYDDWRASPNLDNALAMRDYLWDLLQKYPT